MMLRDGDAMPPTRTLLPELRRLLGSRRLAAHEVAEAVALLRARGLLALAPAAGGAGLRVSFPVPDHAPHAARLAELGARGRFNWRTPIRVTHSQLADIARARAPGRIASLLVALARLEFDADAEGRFAVALVQRAAGISRRSAQRGRAALRADGLLERLPADPRSPSFWRAGGRWRLAAHAAPRAGRRRRGAIPANLREVAPSSDEHSRTAPALPPSARPAVENTAAVQGARARARVARAADSDQRRRARARVPVQRHTPSGPRWPQLADADLLDADALLARVFPVAVARGRLTDTDPARRELLALAAAAWRLAQPGGRSPVPGRPIAPPIANPCGWLVAALERGHSGWAADIDEQSARRRWLAWQRGECEPERAVCEVRRTEVRGVEDRSVRSRAHEPDVADTGRMLSRAEAVAMMDRLMTGRRAG